MGVEGWAETDGGGAEGGVAERRGEGEGEGEARKAT